MLYVLNNPIIGFPIFIICLPWDNLVGLRISTLFMAQLVQLAKLSSGVIVTMLLSFLNTQCASFRFSSLITFKNRRKRLVIVCNLNLTKEKSIYLKTLKVIV